MKKWQSTITTVSVQMNEEEWYEYQKYFEEFNQPSNEL